MPPRFVYTAPDRQFSCPLQCQQCEAQSATTGQRCRKRACIGVPLCWQHLLSERHLRIRASGLGAAAGDGLWAQRSRVAPAAGAPGREVLFREGDLITYYDGEVVTPEILQARYGDLTAPYGIATRGAHREDGACRRGPGSVANHRGQRPNARFSYAAGQGDRATLRATRVIRDGDEIFVSYGRQYALHEEGVSHATRRR